MSERRVPKRVADELGRLYRERAAAEERLVRYLAGVIDTLGIDPELVTGFDDVRRVVIIGDDPEE